MTIRELGYLGHVVTGVAELSGSWTGVLVHLPPVRDIRRTPEAQARARKLGRLIELAPTDMLAEEIGRGWELLG